MFKKLLPLVVGALLLVAPACMKKDETTTIPPRPGQTETKARGSVRAVHKGMPKIDGQQVRDWFGSIKLPGWRRLSIFSEFHPDEGSFVARYGKKNKILYLSYIDNQRMSQFGLPRTAREMLMVGRSSLPQTVELEGRKWYAQKGEQPMLATDATADVRVLLMGYRDLKIEELEELALQLPVGKLKEMSQ